MQLIMCLDMENKSGYLNISLLVGLKNNLEYTQLFYSTTRKLYSTAEIVFVSYGSTDGTHEWLDSLRDEYLKYYYFDEIKSLADTYNKCLDIATKEYCVLLHNDMILTSNFLENLLKHLNNNTVVGYSYIEPPIFSSDLRIGKILYDLGTDTQNIRLEELEKVSLQIQNNDNNKISSGIELRFFISLKTNRLRSINGLDNLFNPMFFEDDDMFLRLEKLNLKFITSLDAICYHFVSKTSRFSEEIIEKTKLIERKSQRNFQRKWGFSSYSDKRRTLNIGILLRNGSIPLMREIEPCCSHLYTDTDYAKYIVEEQPNTKFDLNERIFHLNTAIPIKNYDILIQIDGSLFVDRQLKYIKYIYNTIDKRYNNFFKKIIFMLSGKQIKKKGLIISVNNYK